jgi:hypothetical protein
VIAATVLAVLALVLSYAGRAVLRSEPFADRATAALRDSAVQAEVADRLTDAVVSAHGDLAAVRPLIRTVTGGVVSSAPFAAVFHQAVLAAHRAVVRDDRPRALVNVADAAVLISGVLQRLAPGAAAAVGGERAVGLFDVHPPGVIREVVRAAQAVYTAAWVLSLMAILLAVAALWSAADRARCAWQLGVGLVAGGLVVVGLYLVAGAVIGQTAPAGRGAAAVAIWRALASGLRSEALWLAGAGAVVVGAASVWTSGAARTDEASRRTSLPRRAGASLSREPARSLVIAGVGVAVLLEPAVALSVVAVAAGLLALAVGVAGILRWVTRPRERRHERRVESESKSERKSESESEPARAGDPVANREPESPRRRWPAAVAVCAAGLGAIAVALAVIASGDADQAPAATPSTCNGSALLCGRPLNDVVFPATHNSFASVTIPHFLFGQQDGTIEDQLRFGIRGFTIDTYYGYRTRGPRIRTDTASLPKREAAVQEIGEPAVKAAESIRSRLGARPTGARGIYLCHTFCELGAVALGPTLTQLRSFLINNPGEVVMLINQDEGPTPSDIAAAFERAGLTSLVYRGPMGPFPTLRQMIDSGQRLVVMAENDAGDIPWYHRAYDGALQETPFRFRTTGALTDAATLAGSCQANRGPASAPLFLVNHWVDTSPVPRASNATAVNGYKVLLHRAQTCQRLRHHLPNLIAVDFYREGDVLGVARTLNGVGG